MAYFSFDVGVTELRAAWVMIESSPNGVGEWEQLGPLVKIRPGKVVTIQDTDLDPMVDLPRFYRATTYTSDGTPSPASEVLECEAP